MSRELSRPFQTVLVGKPRARYPKQKHAFMGLLTCGRCGCTMTAERKKGRYTDYRCTGFRGRCGNSYIREELLADLLGDVVKRIQIPSELADWIAEGLRDYEGDLDRNARPPSLDDRPSSACCRPNWIGVTTTTSKGAFHRTSGRGNRGVGGGGGAWLPS